MIHGIKEAREKLKNLASIGDRVSFPEMFNPQFISEHTSFKSIEELFEKSGFKVENEADFKAIPDDEWEQFIVKNTNFQSWESMQKTAFDSLIQSKIEAG